MGLLRAATRDRRLNRAPTPRPTRGAVTLTIDVHIEPADLADALRSDAYRGLTSSPKELPPKWFYDDRGSQLFDEITRLPEYYPTRTERAILTARSDEIARATAADTLVELGSGTSEKTRLLLDALRSAGTLTRFVPFDVSETTLREAAAAIGAEYPGVAVHAVAGDFERHLDLLPTAVAGSSPSSEERSATCFPTRARGSSVRSLRGSDATTRSSSVPIS